ncbi:thermonuclease family protein [Jeotgalibacillus proteolyticus]|uniref:Nuclease n=1 Tax=Jeotgalibacillus proteolyticus TaxID=2082395 RepID=A0A2S5GG26_9BACL|nr:thermonuclease family protein [Jeotgalibacillus proteolyticus]PPA71949.1 nuclease [Jeotgalibacillus proteolyticus]
MKKFLLIIAALGMLAGCSLNGDNDLLTAQVVNVVDGDTIDVELTDGSVERVRLLLIDTPETKHPQLGVQPFGPEAAEYTEKHLTGEKIQLEFDVSERDRYGRVLAYVWLDDSLFNEKLISEGLARVSIYPPDIKYVDEFEHIQEIARRKGVGIWSLENYVTDKGFQRTKKEANNPPQKDGCLIKGNINSKGEKIYHIPSSRYYQNTIPEEWFCAAEEAEKAGFRAPKN